MRLGLEKVLGSLILLTVIAIVGEHKILMTRLELDASRAIISHYNDGSSGGLSSSAISGPRNTEWQCVLRAGHAWPYCGFEWLLDANRQQGVDLRRYDRIRLWLDYEGPTETIRFYLRNYDPRYSRPDQNVSTKYNQIEFDSEPARAQPYIELAMANFFVANWWLQRFRIPPELANPQFENIVLIEVQTGFNYLPGEHRFQLHKIEFTGQLLSTEQWYQLILFSWFTFALALLIVRIVGLNKQVRLKSAQEQELTEINLLLDSRSQALEAKARIDPLTGAFNRQGMEQAMKQGLAEWRHKGKPFSIIMVDLDRFKDINDTYGHAEGDQVLSEVSAVIKQCIRTTDIFARWGGEEFVLVCHDTSLPVAKRIADKVCEAIRQQKIGPEGNLSASIGVATIERGESLDRIFVRVDQAMYRAKQNGRNRVEIAHTAA